MIWRGAIRFFPMNGDYLGPTRNQVIDMYGRFFDRP
jgi:hypothetical protein